MGENSANILVFLRVVSCGTIGMVSVQVDVLDSQLVSRGTNTDISSSLEAFRLNRTCRKG